MLTEEPYDARVSRTVLRETWGEIPLVYSTEKKSKNHNLIAFSKFEI